jgi:hypothetical protein
MISFLVALMLTAPCSESQYVCATEDWGQGILGPKAYYSLQQMLALYPWRAALVSGSSYGGWAFGGPIVPLLDGQSVVIRTSRLPGDPAAGVIIIADHDIIDGGTGGPIAIFDANGNQLLALDLYGRLYMGCPAGVANPYDCGTLVDLTGKSGHPVTKAGPGLYHTTEGRLGEVRALLPDGGQPDPDGGMSNGRPYGPQHVRCDDGGCYFPWAGSHGDHTMADRTPIPGGWGVELRNGSDVTFVTHAATGAFGAPCIARAKFPACPDFTIIPTSNGLFNAYGAHFGALLCAADDMSTYLCKPWGWRKLKDEDD